MTPAILIFLAQASVLIAGVAVAVAIVTSSHSPEDVGRVLPGKQHRGLRKFMRRLLAEKSIPVPREVRDRLRLHRQERASRMTSYAAAWQRNWDRDAERRMHTASARRSNYTLVGK